MKKFLIMFTLFGIVLTGCDKQETSQDENSTPEQLLEAIQGKWVAVSEDLNNTIEVITTIYDPKKDDVPAVIIEGNSYVGGKVEASKDVILKERESHEISLAEDGKLSCMGGLSPRGEALCEIELQNDKLVIVETFSDNPEILTYTYVRSELPVKLAPINLSLNGTANCYIISEPGDYVFYANVKGNGANRQIAGSTSCFLDNVVSAEIYFENYPTGGEYPSFVPNTVLKDVRYEDNLIYFSTAEPFHEGNVLIAAKDAAGHIVWSWHIWVTDQPEELVYANNAGIMMDRNLGAWDTSSDELLHTLTLGFLYQWGRKDPLLHTAIHNRKIASTFKYTPMIAAETIGDGIAYTTQHPEVFVTTDNVNRPFPAWCGVEDTEQGMQLWSTEKTIYDPCPPGWRVPDEIWTKAGLTKMEINDENGFMMPASISGKDSWYPYNYCVAASGSDLSQGIYLSVTRVSDKNSIRLISLTYLDGIHPGSTSTSHGAFVRCQKIQN